MDFFWKGFFRYSFGIFLGSVGFGGGGPLRMLRMSEDSLTIVIDGLDQWNDLRRKRMISALETATEIE